MVALDKEYREGISCGDWRSFRTVSCEAGFCAAVGQVKNDLACETVTLLSGGPGYQRGLCFGEVCRRLQAMQAITW